MNTGIHIAKPLKTKPRGRHPHHALSTAFIRSAPPGRHADGNGLYLYVKPTGTRSWIQRLVIRGRRRELGLGSVALVSLAEARDKARDNRKLAREGGDPLAEKRRASEVVPTFADAAARVVAQQKAGWRDPTYPRVWLRSLELHAFRRIGRMPVTEVTGADVFEVLAPIWHLKPPTARTVRRRMRAVLEWAVAMGLRPDNPCDRVGRVLGPQNDVVRHMKALPPAEVASALEKVRASDTMPVLKLAFEFLVLTAARSAEVRGAAWAEIDIEAGVWSVPARRTKMGREHRVPLCARVVEILEEARRLGNGESPIVFAGGMGTPMDGSRLCRLMKRLRIPAVPHGFRSSFRNWAAEETDHPREVVEAALAHIVKNKVEAAYLRSDLFERRRRLMAEWADYVTGEHGDPEPKASPDPRSVKP